MMESSLLDRGRIQAQIIEEYAFSVIQFVERPYSQIEDYICVPSSWIKKRRDTDRRVKVAYPNEKPSLTEIRVVNGEAVSESWSLYMAVLKYETNSLKDAYEIKHMMTRRLDTFIENRGSDVMSIDPVLLPATAQQANSSMQNNLADFENDDDDGERTTRESFIKNISCSQDDNAKAAFILHESLNSENQAFISNQPYEDHSIKDSVLWDNSEITNDAQSFPAHNHVALNHLNSNEYYQDLQQPETIRILPNYQDYSQNIAFTQEKLGSSICNLKAFLPDFTENTFVLQPLHPPYVIPVNQGNLYHFVHQDMVGDRSMEGDQRAQAIEHDTIFTDNNPFNLSNQASQIQELSQFSQDLIPQDPYGQEISVDQSTADCTNHIPSSHSRAMSVPHAARDYVNSGGYTYPIKDLDENQLLLTSHSQSMENMVVDEFAQENYDTQCCHSETHTENLPSANLNHPNQSSQSDKYSMENQVPTVYKDTNELSMEDIYNEKTSSSDSSTDNRLIASPNFFETAQEPVNVPSLDQLVGLFSTISANFVEASYTGQDIRDSLAESAQIFKSMGNRLRHFQMLKRSRGSVAKLKEPQGTPDTLVENKEQGNFNEDLNMNTKKDINKSKNKSDVDDCTDKRHSDVDENNDMDENNDDNEVIVKKKTRKHSTFVLPPEYDPDDTRWTLNYREPDPERCLVELVPLSRVYVESFKLDNCKRVAKDYNSLARMLLVEIFSQSALSVCSLTGSRANAFANRDVRPGLDKKARIVLMKFVEEHGKKKCWGAFDTHSVLSSIRSKIQEIRAKYSKTV